MSDSIISSTGSSELKERWLKHKLRWLENRVHIADLVLSQSDGIRFATEPDAEILLCCVLGSISAKTWSKGKDSQKFVQLLIDYAPVGVKQISIPYLMQLLEGKPEQQIIADRFWKTPKYQVVNADNVDHDEQKIVETLPNLDLGIIRRASRAHIIYKELRCGLIHEYELGPALTDWNFSEDDELTYTWKEGPVLHFPYRYVKTLVQDTIKAVFNDCITRDRLDLRKPGKPVWLVDIKTARSSI